MLAIKAVFQLLLRKQQTNLLLWCVLQEEEQVALQLSSREPVAMLQCPLIRQNPTNMLQKRTERGIRL
jgi:hypothetical protein